MGNIQGKPFSDVLGEVENGHLLAELTESVYGIIAAVMETRKPGALTLALTFTPTGIMEVQWMDGDVAMRFRPDLDIQMIEDESGTKVTIKGD